VLGRSVHHRRHRHPRHDSSLSLTSTVGVSISGDSVSTGDGHSAVEKQHGLWDFIGANRDNRHPQITRKGGGAGGGDDGDIPQIEGGRQDDTQLLHVSRNSGGSGGGGGGGDDDSEVTQAEDEGRNAYVFENGGGSSTGRMSLVTNRDTETRGYDESSLYDRSTNRGDDIEEHKDDRGGEEKGVDGDIVDSSSQVIPRNEDGDDEKRTGPSDRAHKNEERERGVCTYRECGACTYRNIGRRDCCDICGTSLRAFIPAQR
jgi:hypothetical protein